MKHFPAIIALLLVLASPAQAFVCTAVTNNGPSIYWPERTVYYVLDKKGTTDITAAAELDTLRESFAVWSAVECSDLTFLESNQNYDGKVGFDYLEPAKNQNALLFHDQDWPYSSLIIALTTVTVNNCTGQILDADIEFNSEHYKFTNSDKQIFTDLKNTAVHEIGHFLGLDHTDNTNNVMYPYAATGETRCRELFTDDINALCYRYPSGEATKFCYDNNNCKDDCRSPGNCDYDVTTVVENVGCQSGSADIFSAMILAALLAMSFRRKKENKI